jgi:hypothetical protein
MKKLLMIITAVTLSSYGFSQRLELSGKGSYRSTWIFNDTLSDQGASQDYDAGWGYNYGGGVAFYFTKSIGIEVNGLLGKFNGNYKGKVDSIGKYTSQVTLNTLDIPLLFKLRTKTGSGYIELGPQYSLIQKAYYQMSGDSMSIPSRDVTSKYSDSNFSIMFGMGINIDLSKRIDLTTGIRLEYGLDDIKGLDAVGDAFINPFKYKDPGRTYTAAGGLFLGVIYKIGKLDDAAAPSPAP